MSNKVLTILLIPAFIALKLSGDVHSVLLAVIGIIMILCIALKVILTKKKGGK